MALECAEPGRCASGLLYSELMTEEMSEGFVDDARPKLDNWSDTPNFISEHASSQRKSPPLVVPELSGCGAGVISTSPASATGSVGWCGCRVVDPKRISNTFLVQRR